MSHACCILLHSDQVSWDSNAVSKRHQQENNLIYAISSDIFSGRYLAYLLTFILAFYLDLSGISSEILCGWGSAEVRRGAAEGGRRRRAGRHKSSNPHLTGGKGHSTRETMVMSGRKDLSEYQTLQQSIDSGILPIHHHHAPLTKHYVQMLLIIDREWRWIITVIMNHCHLPMRTIPQSPFLSTCL